MESVPMRRKNALPPPDVRKAILEGDEKKHRAMSSRGGKATVEANKRRAKEKCARDSEITRVQRQANVAELDGDIVIPDDLPQ
jgi:hypothetical protein